VKLYKKNNYVVGYIKLRLNACIIQLQTGQLCRNNIKEQYPINTLSENFSLAKKFVFLLHMEFETGRLK